ncbi:DUF4252 domain-containing protein [Fulvivirga sedimenti]|uniref:DUF4252 domain-containing protein n=1 Tax=Fulvivirga sedimenti TaxID=2879465 RepID=A0A9X1HKA2_9BACT|nr:DUF4252 domain-containing protein [Fulvivirga sedimenti]MCA6073693.1 DUF4252 domain-containing protein [Fulvivirga sedimenti]
MKNLLIVLLFASTAVYSQSKSAAEFQEKYKDDRDATVVSISGSLFNLFANIAEAAEEGDEEAQAMARIAKNINSMKIISVPVYRSGLQPDAILKLRKDLISEKYDELMQVRDGQDHVYFLAQGDEKEVRNMYVLIQEENDFTMLEIDGVLNMSDLAYLARNHGNIDID